MPFHKQEGETSYCLAILSLAHKQSGLCLHRPLTMCDIVGNDDFEILAHCPPCMDERPNKTTISQPGAKTLRFRPLPGKERKDGSLKKWRAEKTQKVLFVAASSLTDKKNARPKSLGVQPTLFVMKQGSCIISTGSVQMIDICLNVSLLLSPKTVNSNSSDGFPQVGSISIKCTPCFN